MKAPNALPHLDVEQNGRESPVYVIQERTPEIREATREEITLLLGEHLATTTIAAGKPTTRGAKLHIKSDHPEGNRFPTISRPNNPQDVFGFITSRGGENVLLHAETGSCQVSGLRDWRKDEDGEKLAGVTGLRI